MNMRLHSFLLTSLPFYAEQSIGTSKDAFSDFEKEVENEDKTIAYLYAILMITVITAPVMAASSHSPESLILNSSIISCMVQCSVV
jgi:hypothetical protein